MPCYDERDSIDREELRQELNTRTTHLCSLCRILEKKGLTAFIPRDIFVWWKKHKAFDKSEGRG